MRVFAPYPARVRFVYATGWRVATSVELIGAHRACGALRRAGFISYVIEEVSDMNFA